ncbi:hypothetical protein [Acinetobacter sp.]|uniref:hypothetical protein n=1 Tax=Acinetobacter sp. TaxID=472 RepID=UPI0038905492
MKTQTLNEFTYNNLATTMVVRVTEYFERADGAPDVFRVRVIYNDDDKLFTPATRSEAMRLGDEAVARFVQELNQIYWTD